jgi:hypothetical protein
MLGKTKNKTCGKRRINISKIIFFWRCLKIEIYPRKLRDITCEFRVNNSIIHSTENSVYLKLYEKYDSPMFDTPLKIKELKKYLSTKKPNNVTSNKTKIKIPREIFCDL